MSTNEGKIDRMSILVHPRHDVVVCTTRVSNAKNGIDAHRGKIESKIDTKNSKGELLLMGQP